MRHMKLPAGPVARVISILCLFVLTLTHTACTGSREEERKEENAYADTFRRHLQTTETVQVYPRQELVLTGKVEYDPDRMIRYTPLMSGVVDATHFSLGDRVAKGQLLADVRSVEYSSLRSEIVAARSAVQLAERELRAARALFDDGMLSEREWMEAQAAVSQAEAELRKTEHDMTVLGSDRPDGAFSLQAPMSGFVVEKNISSGSTISAEGEPLYTIADLSQVWVTVNVYAGDLRFVKEGMEVEMTMLAYPGEVFTGTVTTLSQVFDPEERVLKARIVMPNPDLRLKPEMSVTVKLKDQGRELAVAIPSDALIFDNDRYYVVVEDATGQYEVRQVIPDSHQGDRTFLASGLMEGENVVIQNQLLIYADRKGGY